MADVANLATVGLMGSALWACLGFLTRARASTKTLQLFGFDPARQQRRRAKVSESRPCADPGLSPTSQLAVTAERSAKGPHGRALSPQMSSTAALVFANPLTTDVCALCFGSHWRPARQSNAT